MNVDIDEGVPEATRITASTLDSFGRLCCDPPHTSLLSDPHSLSITQRVGCIGPLTVGELAVDADVSLDFGESCSAYRVILVRSGRFVADHRGSTVTSGPGDVTVYLPQGHHAGRLAAGSRWIGVKIDRYLVDDALSDALGRPVGCQIDFQPTMSTTSSAAASWISMLLLLREQVFRAGGLLARPLVGLPYVDSLVRGLLLAAEYPQRVAVEAQPEPIGSRCIRAALDIIEAEPHLPITVTALAARSYTSIRSLQEGFHRHLGISPMAYLRHVRLRRAHEALQSSDPSIATVASIASQWGFTNPGRFAAAHTAHYGETPVVTLRRTAFRRGAA